MPVMRLIEPFTKNLAVGSSEETRLSRLLPQHSWHGLPVSIRRRFSKSLRHEVSVVYCGDMTEMRASPIGRFFAFCLRVIGAPLPLHSDINVPSVVTVTEDVATQGQIWTRLYSRRDGFPQIIQSAKRFSGPTGLEEYIGSGIIMALRVVAEHNALIFRSAGYSIAFGKRRISIPQWLAPIAVEVRHQFISEKQFLFTLDVRHKWFGELIHQAGIYRDS